MSYRESNGETLLSYLLRLEYRVRYYRFFFLPALYLVLPFFFVRLRECRFVWVALTLLLFALGANFYPFFYPHYIARAHLPVRAGERHRIAAVVPAADLDRPRGRVDDSGSVRSAFRSLVRTAPVRPAGDAAIRDLGRHQSHESGAEDRRQHALAAAPGQQLVIVRYSPRHIFQEEWVYNEADIDAARVVWARDLGPEQDGELLRYYPAARPGCWMRTRNRRD